MSDAVKWGLLVAGALVIISLVSSLPFVQFINVREFGDVVDYVVTVCEDSFRFGRGLINNFFTPFGRDVITGIMIWLVGKWAILVSIKIATWIYHYVFK